MKNLLLVFILFLSLKVVMAQEAIPASGGVATGNGGTVSYTAGQVVFTTNTGSSGSVAQGVQQPYEISVITGIDQFSNIKLTCSAFPNPTTDFLTLKIDGELHSHLIANICDINGKVIISKKIESSETTFSIGILVPSTYFLRLTNINQEIKSFKIVKR
jgi:hypothetical protein